LINHKTLGTAKGVDLPEENLVLLRDSSGDILIDVMMRHKL